MKRFDHRPQLYKSYRSRFKGARLPKSDSSQHWMWRLDGWLPPPEASILDVGCGRGELLATLRTNGYRNTLGIDIAREQIVAAVEGSGPLHCGSALDYLKEHAHTYDLVIAIDFLEHLTKAEALAFIEMVRTSLRGVLILQVPNAAAPRGMYHQAGDLTHETMFSPSSLRQLLLACGFAEPRFREVSPYPYGLKGHIRSALWKGLRRIYQLADMIELGAAPEICSRNMLVCAAPNSAS